jgi:hypothetical protein
MSGDNGGRPRFQRGPRPRSCMRRLAVAISCGLVFAATVRANPPSEAPSNNAAAPSSHASVDLVRSPPGGLKPNHPLSMRHVRKRATLKGLGRTSGKSPEAPP